MTRWVDFKALKQRIGIEQVMATYSVVVCVTVGCRLLELENLARIVEIPCHSS